MTLCGRYMTIALCGLSICLPGCGPTTSPRVSVFIAGDTQGWITPCGCTANQSGGLARRASLVSSSRLVGESILLDVGGSAVGTTPYQRTRFRFLLDGLQKMGLEAHNIGEAETEFSPAELQQIGKETGIRWLSANLSHRDGSKVGPTLLSIKKAGLTIAVTGVIDAGRVHHPDWQASDMTQAVIKSMKDSKADVRIVLAYLDENGLRELATSLPEVDYIIGGPTGQAMSAQKIGNVTVMSATNKGKFLNKLVFSRDNQRVHAINESIAEVKSDLPEDKQQTTNLREYYEELSRKDYSSAESGVVAEGVMHPKGYSIAGADACTSCHPQDTATWVHSRHSHAWDVLATKKANYDPHCQQCHTTGYGLPGGFVRVADSQKQVSVGCESCHGPSQAHTLNPKQRTPFQAKQQCMTCHDHENSPAFQYDAYWAKIVHSGGKVK